jgi:hypothetical protein
VWVHNRDTALIDDIRARFARDEFEFSIHATDQSILRETSVGEIREAMKVGEIIEDYPDDNEPKLFDTWPYSGRAPNSYPFQLSVTPGGKSNYCV